MARIRVTVDSETVMDADLGKWTSEPPPLLRDQLAANAAPKLYMRCLLMVVADAAMTDTETHVDIVTSVSDWTMVVARP